jgi:lysophospholipase L1-like esterase
MKHTRTLLATLLSALTLSAFSPSALRLFSSSPLQPFSSSALQPFPPEPPELNSRGALPRVAAKINSKREVRVAFLGGSITAANGWRVHTLGILRRAFPGAMFTEIYAAVSGTGSDYGACRLQRDVLDKTPDLLLVEFAVNDSGVPSANIEAQMEGIVRQTRTANPGIDICFVYTLSEPHLTALKSGQYQQSAAAMEKVAAHYDIPTIHLGVEVLRRVTANTLVFSAPPSVKADADGKDAEGRIIFTRDKTHPTDAGHRIYALTLERALPVLIKTSAPATTAAALPPPLRDDNWQHAKLILPSPGAKTNAWRQLPATDTVARQAGRMAPPIWTTFTPGATVEFAFKGTRLGIIGLKGSDNGKFRCTIDGQEVETSTLFDTFSTPGRHPLRPWFHAKPLEDTEHHVRLELLPDKIDKAAIMAKAGNPITDETPYAPHGLHLCGLLIVGTPLTAPQLR